MNDLLPAKTLINVIQSCSGRNRFRPEGNYQPQFILFLGSGASKSSGVALASELTDDFRKKYSDQFDTDQLEAEKWYTPETAYSSLFERLYPEPSLRRDYIERVLEYSSPSWGYFYLVDLLRQNVFNTVFTTNFDDLLNEACYLFSSEVRPICCAHDSSIRSLRISTKRPKIIKLHGDFLYDNIKNTLRELESLEQNMRDKFKQYAREFGIIFVGYSGCDRSIMDVLDALLADEGNFPHGVYWCTRNIMSPTAKIDRLTRYSRFHTVQITGFDEFMAELHDALNGDYHPIIDNPHSVSALRMGRLLSALPDTSSFLELHRILERDIIALGKAVRDPEKLKVIPTSYACNAIAALRDGNTTEACDQILNQIADPASTYFAVWSALRLGLEVLETRKDNAFCDKLFEAIETCGAFHKWPAKLNDYALSMIKKSQLSLALRLVECEHKLAGSNSEPVRYLINKAQIAVRQNGKIGQVERKQLKEIAAKNKQATTRFCALVLLRLHKNAVNELEANCSGGMVNGRPLEEIAEWPISELLNASQRKRLHELVIRQ